ncbi:hypothetical protein [Endozoicomonas sp. ALB060]|uniref:hypothetical protein n=1 Tax=Endozoicomonas sp. ALB060 TaxID=3403072 RepID=UPI003BB60C39
MIKLRHYSNLFIAPVFLLLALTTQSTPTTASTAPIKINDAEDLGKIGRDRDYPLDGTYQQTADIVVTKDYQSIGNDTHPFTGEYYGQCRSISGLSNCFVDILKGSISALHFARANIKNSAKPTGLAACVVDDTGTVSDIRAENVHVSTSGNNAHVGIGAGVVDGGGMVTNTMVVNSTVETSGRSAGAGIGGGQVDKAGTVANTMAVNSHVTTSSYGSFAGIGGGWVEGTVANTMAVNSHVTTRGLCIRRHRGGVG